MKLIMQAVVLAVLSALFSGIAVAQTPQEQLSQMVAQLQKTPTDNALREKIIKLAATITPPPAIPEDARRPFVRANTAVKNASGADDYAGAIKLYQDSLLLAPWWGDAYFNLSRAQELHQDYDAAIQSLKFFLLTSPSQADAREAQDHIYALEELRDKKTVSDRKKAEEARAENDKRLAEQARRDVITTIKNIVNNRSYVGKQLSYCRESDCIWSGVNQHELFGGGTYYEFRWFDNIYWKFFDERVEVWGTGNDSQRLQLLGESWGPKVTDMRWFMAKADNTKSETQQVWSYFDLNNGYLYRSFFGTARPLNDSEFDPNKRYNYDLFRPAN